MSVLIRLKTVCMKRGWQPAVYCSHLPYFSKECYLRCHLVVFICGFQLREGGLEGERGGNKLMQLLF